LVSVAAIRRDAQILSNASADKLLQPNDELFVLGPPEKIAEAAGLLRNREEREMS
jgi:K+/H+ antiporter YhaU regulatory subunit KhtT